MPLDDVDPNVRRRLRSGSTSTEAAPPRPAKRPRGRPPILSTRIEPLEPEGPRPRGRPQTRPQTRPIIDETLRPRGRPTTLFDPSIETSRPRGRPTTLSIYQDPDSDHELPLRAGSQVLPPVRHNSDREVPLRAGSPAPPLVRQSSVSFRGFISVYNPRADPHSLGPMGHECEFCTAVHFIQEAVAPNQERLMFESCCKKGDAHLDPLKGVPPYLRSLYESQSADGQHFRQNIRSYNNALAFTSVSYTKDTRIDFSMGVQVFSIHGELFHYQGSLIPGSQEAPKFAQLLFYDPDYATDVRMQRHTQLDQSVLKQLALELLACNPFISLYKTAYERLQQQQQDQPLRILLNPQMRLIVEAGADRRRENLPTGDEVAVIIPNEYTEASRRDILLAVRDPVYRQSHLEKVPVTNAAYMPLHYVLLFPRGDLGWHYGMTLRDAAGVRERTRLEQRMFYRYRLSIRKNEFSPLFYARSLFQQYIVDAYVACETANLDWIRTHQGHLRSDVYNGLTDALRQGDVDPANLGRRYILPSSFTGSERYMQQVYQDSMAIVRHFGKPTFFITFTANPKWPEIVENLLPGQQPNDRPDLITRVFFLKVKELIADLRNDLFGPYQGHVYTVEYQKRCLPHIHLLLFIAPTYQYDTADKVDEVVCAELPDPSWDPTGELTDLVMSTMSHGPCGADNPLAPCMVRNNETGPAYCSKRFPKNFTAQTRVLEDSYPEYRRRDDGRTFTVPKPGSPTESVVRDNRWVVPYNPYLLQKFRAHINVEICATIEAVKYIGGYMTKGYDKSTIRVDSNDEVAQHCQGRYVGPCEAYARLFEYRQHGLYPPVQQLAVHLENEHVVYFSDDLDEFQIQERKEQARSTLMAFFDYNREHDDGRGLLYSEFPKHYTWVPKTRSWKPRQRGTSIGRMYYCSPLAGERYYLRLLLTVVRGPRSFEDLYWHEGVRYPTYRAACVAYGLAEDDQEWFQCFEEAVHFTKGHGLRMLFITALRHELLGDPLAIWDRFKDHFCDDLLYQLRQPPINFPLPLLHPEYDYGLFLIGQELAKCQRTLEGCKLPVNTVDWSRIHASAREQEEQATSAQLGHQLQSQLNTDQASCFDAITVAITDDPQTAQFYLQGPGGTGKTFLYKALCHYYRGLGRNVLCVASTGIAALLLPNGRTAHSTFKIPIDIHESATCTLSMSSPAAHSLRAVDLIIWDEVPMQHRYCFEVVHRLFCDLRSIPHDSPDVPLFGGIPVILGGDFAQILPVVPGGSRADTVSACLQQSFIWPRLKQLRLRTNMRVRNGPQDDLFRDWVGSLPYNSALHNSISIPSYISQPKLILELIRLIYPDAVLQNNRDHAVFRDRAILATRNSTVDELNALIMQRFPGALRTYRSIDSTDANEAAEGVEQIPVEFLQDQSPSGLPLSRLELKVGVPVMLLRNLLPNHGLCNGTRMVVTQLRNHCMQCRILGGEFDGELRTIPKIKLEYKGKELPFALYRKQFPVRVCFAMTINKSQGQTFHHVGVDLRYPAFSHGQFYVAASRVSSAAGLHILLASDRATTDNVVYPEVLEDLN